MGLFSFLFENSDGVLIDYASELITLKAEELRAKEFAIEKCIGMIANAISKLEINVYKPVNGKVTTVRDNTYYRLNVRPNPNEDATTFFKNVVWKLLREGDALVVQEGPYMYLAESFDMSDQILSPKIFTKVQLRTLNEAKTYTMNRSYGMDDVFYFSLGESKIKHMLNQLFIDYGKMLGFASLDFKIKNGRKFRLKAPQHFTIKVQDSEKTLSIKEYVKIIADDLFSDDPAILSIPEAIDLSSLSGSGADAKTSQDYRDLLKNAFEIVAMAFDIPSDIFLGNKTDKSTSSPDMINNAIAPILEIFEDGINSKLFSQDEYLKGSKISIERTKLQHTSILDFSKEAESLFRIGFSHNEIRSMGGLEPIDELWANEHYVTKNYTSEKGGEEK